MANVTYISFLYITLPLLFLLYVIRDKFGRAVVGFLLAGVFCCLCSSELNGLALAACNSDFAYVTTRITPITEELIKALPVLFSASLFTDEQEKLVSVACAVGIGFATMESLAILVQNALSVNLAWAPVRGIGSALMHGICTGAVGLGVHFIHEKKRMFVPAALALLLTAMTYHSLYNTLVQSEYRYACVLLPLATLGALYLYRRRVAMLKERRRRELFGAKKTAADGARGQNAA